MSEVKAELPVVESPSLQPYPISQLTDDQLNNLEFNYRRKNKVTGGKWSLAEVLHEKELRRADENDPESIVRVIVANCRRSIDGQMTYDSLWRSLRSNQKFTGHYSQRIVMRALDNVIKYCAANSLPQFCCLVVQTKNRQLTQNAIENIKKSCSAAGCHVSPTADQYVIRQAALARRFVRILA